MNRRDFFDPRHLTPLAGPLLGSLDGGGEDPSSEPVNLRFTRQAMATTFEIILPFGTPHSHQSALAGLDEIDRLESQLTVYRETSEVSRLNARAARQPVVVSPSLFGLIRDSLQFHAETEGAFDIAVGSMIKAWGFHRRSGMIPAESERRRIHEQCGSQHVKLDPARLSVFFERPGLEINLGSIGKGYALDQALATMQRLGRVADVLLHGGHSSVLACGDEAPGRRGWLVGLTDPRQSGCRRAMIRLQDRALATSATTFQHFVHEGRTLGHILDPRRGWPAAGMLSATVTAPSAGEADALATAFFILGVEKAQGYCAAHPQVGAVLITQAEPGRLLLLGRAVDEIQANPP